MKIKKQLLEESCFLFYLVLKECYAFFSTLRSANASLGWSRRIELPSPEPQSGALPLSYDHHARKPRLACGTWRSVKVKTKFSSTIRPRQDSNPQPSLSFLASLLGRNRTPITGLEDPCSIR